MIKSIIKEIIIMLLLCLAVVLLFAIVFYDYVPIAKVIPNKVSYTVPEEVKTELESEMKEVELQEQTINYSVSAQDLREYENSGVYEKGNPNPFKAYSVSGNSTIIEGDNDNTTGQGGNSSTNYYPNNSSTK